jgi:parallel beta-helix repeat protein
VNTAGATLRSNTADGNVGNGIGFFSSSGNTIQFNTARNNGGDGLLADALSTGNQFSFNAMSGNQRLDAEDLSTGSGTAGTGNVWVSNTGFTDNKGGLLV